MPRAGGKAPVIDPPSALRFSGPRRPDRRIPDREDAVVPPLNARDLAEQGLAILLITDEVTEALYNSDRVLHMAHGEIVGEFDPRTTSVHAMEESIYG